MASSDILSMEDELHLYAHAAFAFPARAKSAWRWIREHEGSSSLADLGNRWPEGLVAWPSEHYPKGLRDLEFPPPALFHQGALQPRRRISVGIVGTRDADLYSSRLAFVLARALAHKDISVVSGGARGVDQCAHEGALSVGGHTVFVSAGGLDQSGSSRVSRLRREIVEKEGLIVSEMPPGNRVKPYHFLLRNRLVAALSDVLIVIASRTKGGSMETVRCAHMLARPVFAVPGDVVYETSKGTNALIASGSAGLFEHPRQVWEALGLLAPVVDWPRAGNRIGVLPSCWLEETEYESRPEGKSAHKPSDLGKEILSVVGSSPITIAECAERVCKPLSLVTGEVQKLVLSARIVRIPGNRILQEPR